jgi:hypothetical protein
MGLEDTSKVVLGVNEVYIFRLVTQSLVILQDGCQTTTSTQQGLGGLIIRVYSSKYYY